MNRRARRAKARKMAKDRPERKAVARALKTLEVVEGVEADPYPELRRAGFVVAGPKLQVPGGPRTGP